MFNVCPNCGEYRVDKIIVPDGPYAVCPNCEYQHKFLRLPLFVLTGASGVGKTTTCLALAAKTKNVVVMETDILWRDEFNQPATDYRNYRETWLRVCKNISQAGKPVILCGAGVPAQFEQCVERRYFSDIHYLALVCEDEVLVSRLRSRPAWRGSSADEYIKEHVVAITNTGAGTIRQFDGVQVVGLPDSACTSSLDFKDMPGMSLPFKMPARGRVVVLFQGQFGGSTSTAGARAIIRFTIDGNIVGSAIAVGNDHGTGMQTFGFNAFSDQLKPGLHTAKVLWHTSPSGETSCVEERSLIILHQ